MLQGRTILFLLGLSITGLLYSQTTWYVSESGNDLNRGTTVEAPLKTIQSAMDKMAHWDIVYIRQGVYREMVDVKKSYIKILAYPGETPILKGSDIMTGWEAHGTCWKIFVDVQPQQVFVDGNHPLQQIGYPSDWFRNQTNYSVFNNPVGSGIGDMAAGRFFWQNDTLYVWLDDSSDPNIHTIEVSQRRYIFSVYGVHDNYIKGLQFEHSNGNTWNSQTSAVQLGEKSVLDSCLVQWCDFGGVGMGYNTGGSQVLNSVVVHNGALGIGSAATEGFLIRNTRMAYNNYRNFYSQWHAGGFKGATNAYGTIENCEIDNNNGAGVWFDYCLYSARNDDIDGENQYPIIVRNNYFHNNGTGSYNTNGINNNASILIEVSEQALVYNNIIDTFEYRGIWISGSYNSYVTNNLITNSTGGSIALDAGAIYVASPPGYLKNNVIQNNIILNNKTDTDVRMKVEDGTVVFNNNCSNNLIYREGGSIRMMYGASTKTSIEQWRSTTPYGQNSISVDPGFADTLYHLADDSPCINTGADIANDTIINDYEGNSRIIGLITDIGPYESVAGGTISNAFLQSLTVDNGILESDFFPDTFAYVDTLSDNTAQTPVVTAVPDYSGASVITSDAADVLSEDEDDRTTTIKVTSENGLLANEYKIIFYSRNTVGVNEIEKGKFKLYPNPSTGMIHIESNMVNEIINLRVLNLTGKEVYTQSFVSLNGKEFIDLRYLSVGIYFLVISSDKTSGAFKLQITK